VTILGCEFRAPFGKRLRQICRLLALFVVFSRSVEEDLKKPFVNAA
jgi:hypothetical protein